MRLKDNDLRIETRNVRTFYWLDATAHLAHILTKRRADDEVNNTFYAKLQ